MSEDDSPTIPDGMLDMAKARGRGEWVDEAAIDPALLSDLDAAFDACRSAGFDLTRDAEARPPIPGYDIVRKIATSGQASVWEAYEQTTNRHVAIKILRQDHHAALTERDRLRTEAEILRSLDHPNIVPFAGVGTMPGGAPYLATQFIDGDPLSILFNPSDLAWNSLSIAVDDGASVRRSLRMYPDPVSVFVIVCRAVHAAHEAGVVHGDLKPSNIRLDYDGKPFVIDFGLSQTLVPEGDIEMSISIAQQFVGSLPWASPEQAEGHKQLDRRSDVYSLGVILYQLLSAGAFPYAVHGSLHRILNNIITVKPSPLGGGGENSSRSRAAIRVLVDPQLQAIVDKTLEKKPDARYATAAGLADDLDRFLKGQRPLAYRPSRAKHWIAASAITLLAAASVFAWRQSIDRSSATSTIAPLATWYDPVVGDSFSYCPPGKFIMGSTTPFSADTRAHPVTIKQGFWLCSVEVTQGLYQRVMGNNPSRFKKGKEPERLPVEQVTYNDAIAFCEKLSALTGRKYRLPTEEEWEYACRSGATTDFAFGNDQRLMVRFGNCADRSTTYDRAIVHGNYNDGYAETSPVGRFHSSAWWINDMYGNVWEWTAAPYRVDENDPGTTVPPLASIRGGSWHDAPESYLTYVRNPQPLDFKNFNVGFRIVLEREPPTTLPVSMQPSILPQ